MHEHHNSLRETAILLEEAKMHKRYPKIVLPVLRAFWQFHDSGPLKWLLKVTPQIINEAKAILAAKEKAQAECPFTIPYKPEELTILKGDENALPIGRVSFLDDQFNLNRNELCKTVLTLGNPGTGKTTLYLNILRDILSKSVAERRFNVIIFDLKADYHHLCQLYPDIYYLRGRDIKYNFYEPINGELPEDFVSSRTRTISNAFYLAAITEPMHIWTMHRCMERYQAFSCKEMNKELFEIKKQEKQKLDGMNIREGFARLHLRMGLASSYNGGNSFATTRTYPLPFWQNEDIIINLNDLDPYLGRAFVVDLATRLFRYAMIHNLRDQNLRTLFVCDEGSRIFDAAKDNAEYDSNQCLDDILRQGREYGLGWLIGTQQSTWISKVVKHNAGTIMCFYVNPETWDDEKKLLGLNDEQTGYFPFLRNPGEAVVRMPYYAEPFTVRVPYRQFPKDMTVQQASDMCADKIEALNENLRKQQSFEERERFIKALEKEPGLADILLALHDNPFLHKTALMKKVVSKGSLTQKTFPSAINGLTMNGFLAPAVQCHTAKRAKPASFYPLTEKAQGYLGIPKENRIAPSHFKHTYYIFRVAQRLEADGHHDVHVEYSPASLNGTERIDVAVLDHDHNPPELTAYEIQLSHSSVAANISKCLKAGAKTIFFLTEDANSQQKIDKSAIELVAPRERGTIEVHLVTDFF